MQRMIKNSICRRKEITEEKQKLDKNVNAAGEKKIGKDKTRSTERNEGGKESDRSRHRKGMKARKTTKGKRVKTTSSLHDRSLLTFAFPSLERDTFVFGGFDLYSIRIHIPYVDLFGGSSYIYIYIYSVR